MEGKFSGLLAAIKTVLDTNKATIGLAEVRIGERRGYQSPACFIFLAPPGITRSRESGRTGDDEYDVSVNIVVLTKKYQESDDEKVLLMLEKCVDVLDANAPIGGATDIKVPNAGAVEPSAIDDKGVYETVGVQQLIFPVQLDRR